MNTLRLSLSTFGRWLGLALLLCMAAGVRAADADPPGRVGRLAELQGGVWWFDHEQGQWADAERNLPLTSGDRISTAPQARAELRVGSTVLRLAGGTELELLRLDDERMSLQLHSGSLALRVRTRDLADEIDLVTQEARLRPQRAGHYRLDRIDDTTRAAVWRGTLAVVDQAGLLVETGQRLELWREGRRDGRAELRHDWTAPADDAFAAWALAEDLRDERSAASRYVSPEMTGAEDLDRYGRWEQHPEYGALWLPLEVRADWSPYRHGRWAWVRPWGWTWVDEAPWGFAPFHYGRWVHWRGRWGWAPGEYIVRPVFAPALVAWVGGGGFGVSISVGGPLVGWVPLAPREPYRPWYRSSPRHVEYINERPWRGQRPTPVGPVMYGNQGVPGGVTVVPRDVLRQRQPVGRAVVDERQGRPDRVPAGPQPGGRGAPGANEWRAPLQPAEPPGREPRPVVRPPVMVQPGAAVPGRHPGGTAPVQPVLPGVQPLPGRDGPPAARPQPDERRPERPWGDERRPDRGQADERRPDRAVPDERRPDRAVPEDRRPERQPDDRRPERGWRGAEGGPAAAEPTRPALPPSIEQRRERMLPLPQPPGPAAQPVQPAARPVQPAAQALQPAANPVTVAPPVAQQPAPAARPAPPPAPPPPVVRGRGRDDEPDRPPGRDDERKARPPNREREQQR